MLVVGKQGDNKLKWAWAEFGGTHATLACSWSGRVACPRCLPWRSNRAGASHPSRPQACQATGLFRSHPTTSMPSDGVIPEPPDHKHAKRRVIPEPPLPTTLMPLVLVFSHVSLHPVTIDPQPVVSL